MILYLSLALCIFVSQHHSNSNVPTQVVPELSPELAALNLNMEELTQSAFDLRFIPFFFTNIILSLWLFFWFFATTFVSVSLSRSNFWTSEPSGQGCRFQQYWQTAMVVMEPTHTQITSVFQTFPQEGSTIGKRSTSYFKTLQISWFAFIKKGA